MIYKIAAHSDVGIVKKTNQDSVLVKIAQTNHDKVCLSHTTHRQTMIRFVCVSCVTEWAVWLMVSWPVRQ